MSKENLERFMTQVADSEDLQAKIGEEITGDALVALGAAHGCEFSIEDVQASAELSDEELDQVAGGAFTVNGGNPLVRPTRGSGSHDSRQVTFVGTSEGNAVRLRITPSDPRIL